VRAGLDDAAALRAGDPRGMVAAFVSTGSQIRDGYDAARGAAIPFAGEARSVAFCAMGGSAAAGDVVGAALGDRVRVPMVTLRGYRVPAGFGEEAMAVCVSYSGDTEETLAAFSAAREQGCSVVAVCRGGRLADRAAEVDVPVVRIPGRAPVPRAGLGELVGGILGGLAGAGVLSSAEEEVVRAAGAVEEAAAELGPDVPTGENEAKDLAGWVGERTPLIWGSEGVSAAAAWRWKTGFNENAEVPAFASALPELDHHEIVGWTAKRGKGFCVVILREEGEHHSVQSRLDATLDELADSGLEWREVRAGGETALARGMSLALLGDLASTYHALARGIDPSAMEPLERIKERLREPRP
jgi:glucose/mannose-6-phosphate isomerase